MRILVTPERLQEIAAHLRRASDWLEQALRTFRHVWAELDWETRQAADLEMLFLQAQRQAMLLQEEAERLTRYVQERGQAFAQADLEGNALLAQTTTAFRALTIASGTTFSLIATFPAVRAEAYTRLGMLFSGEPPQALIPLTRVPLEAEERRALINFNPASLLAKMDAPGRLQELFEPTQIPRWNEQVNQAMSRWEQARLQFAPQSPQAQAAYRQYLETLLFKIPFRSPQAKAGIILAEILSKAYAG